MGLAELEQELERLHRASFSWSLACCRYEVAEAEDVLHESYLKVMDGRARFDGHSSFKTWLFAVIRRTASERRRRAWLQPLRWFEPRAAEAPDVDLERAQRRGRVRAALVRLAARQREVLELVFFHELTVEQASAVMGVTVGTARVHYDRAKRRLLEEVGDE